MLVGKMCLMIFLAKVRLRYVKGSSAILEAHRDRSNTDNDQGLTLDFKKHDFRCPSPTLDKPPILDPLFLHLTHPPYLKTFR